MKLVSPNRQSHAMTLFEVFVVIAAVLIVVAILLPVLAASRRKSSRIGCVNNLKQIGLAARVWSGDNYDKYPMEVSTTNGGAMELQGQNAWIYYLVMSNELSTPKILICPQDAERPKAATNFSADLKNKISYFVGLDASYGHPRALLSGDDNFSIGGATVKSGAIDLSLKTQVGWTTARHNLHGNICLTDDSIWSTDDKSLVQMLKSTGLATNRLAIP